MTTYYIAHGSYPTYAATPTTWGVPQDGDGLAKTVSSSSSIASILVNSVAVATNTIVIMGVTLTAVASGATVTQFNVGATTSIQADNIANAINLATGLVSSTVSNTTHQLRNMVYARGPTLGAPANTVQIMTRAGANNLNYSVNTNVAITSSGWGTAPTITNFAGGVSGCWGYYFNDDLQGTTIWPTALAKGTYGAMYRDVGLGSLAGQYMTIKDICYVRTNNTIITFPTTVALGANHSTNGIFIVDDGTIWTGDTGYLKLRAVSTVAYGLTFGAAASTKFKLTSINKAKLIFENTTTCTQPFTIGGNAVSGGNCSFQIDNFTVNDYTLTATAGFYIGSGTPAYNGAEQSFTNFIFNIFVNKYYSMIGGVTTAGYNSVVSVIDSGVFNLPFYTGTPATGVVASIGLLSSGGPSNHHIFLRNLQINITNKPYLFVGSVTSGSVSSGNRLIAENIGGVLPFPTLGLLGANTGFIGPEELAFVLQQSVGSVKQYKFESTAVVVDWTPGAGYPTLNSTLPDGTSEVMSVLWVGSLLAAALRDSGTEMLRMRTTVNQAGMQTVALEMLFDPAIASSITTQYLGLTCAYVAAIDSTIRSETNHLSYISGTALSASSAAWTLNNYPSYITKTLTLTLSTPIQINTMLEVRLECFKANPKANGSVTQFFVNNDVSLS